MIGRSSLALAPVDGKVEMRNVGLLVEAERREQAAAVAAVVLTDPSITETARTAAFTPGDCSF